MNEISETANGLPAILDGYVVQGRAFITNAAQNMLQFGRVLCEAKPYVPHGQFEKWVQDNFDMKPTSAQTYMNAWRRYGNQERFADVKFSTLCAMLALPAGTENDFADTHDLSSMSVREVKEAVKQAREDGRREGADEALKRAAEIETDAHRRTQERSQAEIDAAVAEAVRKTEERVRAEYAEMERDAAEKDDQRRILSEAANAAKARETAARNELTRMQQVAKDALDESNEAHKALMRARAELKETEEALKDQQAEYDRMRDQLLNAESVMAKGDAERVVSDRLGADEFAAAVRAFIGTTAQVPFMGAAFALMRQDERAVWIESLNAVRDWAKRAGKAIETVSGEVVVNG